MRLNSGYVSVELYSYSLDGTFFEGHHFSVHSRVLSEIGVEFHYQIITHEVLHCDEIRL